MPIVMGTAGHVDHGKTTLVRALTGIDCDRLAEEKKRGITIELGFAFLDLKPGRLGIVDVPGHERFVKNMVAGATGIDFVLLVIASDEGIMPQTREHLEICQLLGIETGLVAITKADMSDAEWLEMVSGEVEDYLQGTFLEGAPVIPVSAKTGQGVDTLKAALESMMESFAPKRRTDLFRLPVDRVFTMRGHGTVVTGTMISGELSLGEEVEVSPSGKRAKVRGLQSHGETVEVATAGKRTAVNMQSLDVADLQRGQVLCRPGTLFPSLVWDAEITCLSSSPRALKHRKEIHLHHGSREVMARLEFLDREVLAPGETALCRVRFEHPLAGVFGDRLVLRSFSPLRTVAGGKLLNPLGRRLKRFSAEVERLAELGSGSGEERIARQLAWAGPKGLSYAQLRVAGDLDSKGLDKTLQNMGSRQLALCFDKEEQRYVGGETLSGLNAGLEEHMRAFHENEPMKPGLSRSALASSWGRKIPPKLFHLVVERLLKDGALETEQDLIKLAGYKVSLASDVAGLRDRIREIYFQAGATPPNLKDVLESLDVNQGEAMPVFSMLTDQGDLVKVKEDMFFASDAIQDIEESMRKFYQDNEEMGPPDFKAITGLSRKYTIPLLEYFDKAKITVRVGDKRRLRKK